MLSVIPVGEWLPDLPEFANRGALVAKNVVPDSVGYLPLPSLEEAYNALVERAQGHIAVKRTNGAVINYAGDAKYLYRLDSASWTNVSRATTSPTYAVPSEGTWEFAQWNETVIAVNGIDVPQRISLDANAFTALPGGPPTAKHIAIVKNFVVLGNTDTAANEVPRTKSGGAR